MEKRLNSAADLRVSASHRGISHHAPSPHASTTTVQQSQGRYNTERRNATPFQGPSKPKPKLNSNHIPSDETDRLTCRSWSLSLPPTTTAAGLLAGHCLHSSLHTVPYRLTALHYTPQTPTALQSLIPRIPLDYLRYPSRYCPTLLNTLVNPLSFDTSTLAQKTPTRPRLISTAPVSTAALIEPCTNPSL